MRPYISRGRKAKSRSKLDLMAHIEPEELVGEEWAEWYRLTPTQRWALQADMWATYLALGGSLDPEPDPQSPFFNEEEWRAGLADGRSSVRIIRRSGI